MHVPLPQTGHALFLFGPPRAVAHCGVAAPLGSPLTVIDPSQ